MAFADYLPSYFADFGSDATVGGVPVRGIFNNGYDGALGGIIASSAPVLKCVQADVPSVPVGTTVVVNGSTYKVAEVQDDGTGMRDLVLKS